MNRTTRLTAVGLVALAASLPALPATAKDGDVVRRGSCSGNADWKIKASPQDGRIEVESEVDSNANGQTWTWKLTHNGSKSASGTKTTAAPSGSFTVRRVVVDLKGDDVLVFRATNSRSGEVCRASVTY